MDRNLFEASLKMMQVMSRLLKGSTGLTLSIGCVATLLMMLHVTANVVSRLSFGRPVGGTLEWVTYVYMVAVVFLPLATVQQRRQQIIVEILTQLLPRRGLAMLDGCVAVLGCAFMLALTWFGAMEAWDQTLIREAAPSPENPVPIWPARWLVVLGAALVTVHLARQACADLRVAWVGTPGGPGLDVSASHAGHGEALGHAGNTLKNV